MLSLKAFLNERLAAVAEEIFGAVEKTIDEYKEELCRVKDLEIGRLRMQLRLLKSDACNGVQLQEHTHHHLPPPPPPPAPQKHEEAAASVDMEAPESQNIEEEGSSSILEHPNETAHVKKEPERNHREFWLGHGSEPLEDLESDIKDFMSSASGVRGGLHDPILPFHLYHHGGMGDEGKEKPYSCSVCDKRFGNCSHLAAHIRTHTGERPYRCDICRKSFVTTSALNRHQTIHTEGKHYVCIYCSKAFKWMESLGRHVRIAHKRPNAPQ
ncbi:zinc finger protein 112-like [Phycodurus eques]|uniref:zinc finger protein 112-like n=1 Tax=Phycodurus eques TaxID=693459 RepID=UPI002ACD3230|nr:zinc finger protein 112-like [Phycodurus eques]